jgi:LysR family transcriptional regulator, glycine cleavage system transcriptional activator
MNCGPILNQASMAIDAAVDAQGIALARTALAIWDLVARRLIRPFGLALPVSYAYRLPESDCEIAEDCGIQ